ncbi:MAG: class I SAM-dependent methyltransferase [Acidimicrobiales bacterium]
MTRSVVWHPIFARFYSWLSCRGDAAGMADHRDELLAGLVGRGVEVGAGNGLNFSHYPSSVTEVIAVEPEPYLRARAVSAARDADVPVTVVDGTADALALRGASLDFAVVSLVLCSVSSQHAALREIKRVLRPGGELRFYEHVRSESASLARWQCAVAPFWKVVGGGCQPDRDTVSAIEHAGFTINQIRSFMFESGPRIVCGIVAPHVIGRAVIV